MQLMEARASISGVQRRPRVPTMRHSLTGAGTSAFSATYRVFLCLWSWLRTRYARARARRGETRRLWFQRSMTVHSRAVLISTLTCTGIHEPIQAVEPSRMHVRSSSSAAALTGALWIRCAAHAYAYACATDSTCAPRGRVRSYVTLAGLPYDVRRRRTNIQTLAVCRMEAGKVGPACA